MIRFVAGALVGLLLAGPSALAIEPPAPRPCVLAVLAERGAEIMRKAIPSVRAGDYLLASECWHES